MYLKGPDGTYADMDIDCDGLNASTGLCNNDPSGQSQTAFQSEVQEFGIDDLDAHVHPYVVLGNEGADPSFDPQSAGVQPLSVVAVVCNGQLVSLRPCPAFSPLFPRARARSVIGSLGRLGLRREVGGWRERSDDGLG